MDEQNNFNSEEKFSEFQEQSREQNYQTPPNNNEAPHNDFQSSPPPRGPRKKRGGVGVAAVICIIIGSLIIGSVLGISVIYSLDDFNFNNPAQSTPTPQAPQNTNSTVNSDLLKPGTTEIPDVSAPAISQEEPIVEIAEKRGPSVVSIFVETPTGQGWGSGVIFTEDGYIITNHHVIENAQKITVYLSDGTELEAGLAGTDERTELAVVKILKEGTYPAAPLGSSGDLKVGELVVVIGTPLGLFSTVTSGIVSALNRTVDADGRRFQMIQTDAAVNPGNSGGPLFDKEGNVIGIITMKEVTTYDSNGNAISVEGLGYAIPIDDAKPIVLQLMNDGKVTRAGLGVTCSTAYDRFTGEESGVIIASVVEGGPAANAGLKVDDVIVEVDSETVSNLADLTAIMESKAVGDEITVTALRRGERMTFTLLLDVLQN